MARYQTVAARFEETRAASTAGGGTSLSTTEAYVTFVPGSDWFSATPRNFSTAVVAKVALQPYLVVYKTTDNLASSPTDASFLLQDGSTTVTFGLNSFDTLANKNALYIGSHVPFAGLYVDVQNTNSNSSTLTANYYNGGTLVSLSATDNTASGGATLAQDGTITWTVPTDWAVADLLTVAPVATFQQSMSPHYLINQSLYWVQLVVSAALDSSVSINSILGLPRSSAYQELVSGQSWEESIANKLGGYSGLAAKTDAGTASLVVNNATYGKFRTVAQAAIS